MVADIVKSTIGPLGKTVIIKRRNGDIMITKDGATVAKEIYASRKAKDVGAKLLKEVTLRTNDKAGDGTTTATVLAQTLIKECIKYVTCGYSAEKIKNQIDLLQDITIGLLNKEKKYVKSIHEIRQIATIASNNDKEIGKLIAKAFLKIGKEGVITIEDSEITKNRLDIAKGMQIDGGYMSPYFVNQMDKQMCVLDNPYLLICNKKISTINDIVGVLENVSKRGLSIVLIVNDMDSDVLATLVLNNIRRTLKIAVVKSLGFGEERRSMLEDICCLTGAKLVSDEERNISSVGLSGMGRCGRVKISKDRTIIINGKGSKESVRKRVSILKRLCKKDITVSDKNIIKERIAKLSRGIAIIRIGGVTETERKEKKYRVEDALNATKSAIEDGFVHGGGFALYRIAEKIKNSDMENPYKDIFVNMLVRPMIQIMENASIDYRTVIHKIKNNIGFGIDVKRGEFCNLIRRGIIDPTKVVKHAIKNACSIAKLLISSQCLIINKDQKTIE
ncbi:chaperonin GroEL [Candidatus Vidania fulgoroideorum]